MTRAAAGPTAAATALRLGRLADAERLARTAWSDARDPSTRAGLAIDLADALVAQRRHPEALALLGTALSTPGLAVTVRAGLYLSAARCQLRVGRKTRDARNIDNAVALARAAVSACEASGQCATAATAALGDALILAGATGSALHELRGIARALRAGDATDFPDAALAVARLRMAQLRFRSALWWSRQAGIRHRGSLPPFAPLILEADMTAAIASWRVGDLDTAVDLLRSVVEREAAALLAAMHVDDGPDRWARSRVANDAAEMLAAILWRRDAAGDRAELAQLLLSRRGSARVARVAARRGVAPPGRDPAALGPRVIALLPLHPLAALDPAAGWNVEQEETRIILIAVHGDDPPVVRDLGEWERLVADMTAWRGRVYRGGKSPLPAILAEIAVLGSGAERIAILVDGVVETLPWTLIFECPVQVASSREGCFARAPSSDVSLVAVTSAFDRRSPALAREIATAGTYSRDPVQVLPPEFEPAAMLATAANVRHLHLIAHGVAGRDAPEEPFNPYAVGGLRLDRHVLSAADIAAAWLHGTELVVLAGCSTARGVRQFGEGKASLAAAFLDAGVQVVIASIWEVPNRETAEFMALFYAERNRDPVAALAAAQRRAAAQGMRPAGWAGWNCYALCASPSIGSAKQANAAQ